MGNAQTVKQSLGATPTPVAEVPPASATGGADLALVGDLPPDIARGAMKDVSIDARIRYARELAHAGLLPEAFRRQPANVLYAVEYGNMLGIHPLAAMTGVHVMDGKPTASSALMGALVRRARHRLRVKVTGTVQGGDLAATAEIIRADDPEFTYSATWTLDRALRAGLIDALNVDERGRTLVRARTPKGKPSSWEKFPEAMAKARAISEVAREACEEALCGVHYTPEELGAVVDEDENVITGEVVQEQPSAPVQDGPGGEVDYVGLAAAASDVAGVREIWRQASEAGALDEALADELSRIATEKHQAAQQDEGGDGVVDADVVEDGAPEQPTLEVEDPPGCDVRGCTDPASHDRAGHKAWLRGQQTPEASREALSDGGWPEVVQPGTAGQRRDGDQ